MRRIVKITKVSAAVYVVSVILLIAGAVIVKNHLGRFSYEVLTGYILCTVSAFSFISNTIVLLVKK